jgi:hypothetical protein
MILIPVLMLAFSATALAKDPPKPKPAKLVAEPNKADFGKITGNESKDVTVQIKNTGEAEAKDVKCVAGGTLSKNITVSPEAITVTGGKDGKPVDLKITLKIEPLAKKMGKGKDKDKDITKEEKKAGEVKCDKLRIPVIVVQTPGEKMAEVKKEEPKKEEPKPAEPVAPKAEDKKEEPKKEEPKKEEPKKDAPPAPPAK